MHQAFIQDAEHDVDHHQRGQNKHWLLALRSLRIARCSLKAAAHIVGHANLGLGAQHRCLTISQRDTIMQVVRHRGGQLAVLMVDG